VGKGAAGEAAVGEQLSARVRCHVGVRGAARVVAGKDGLELDDAGVVAHLGAAQEGGVEAALGGDARVGAGGVAVPEVDEQLGDGFAGGGVDELHVEVEGHAGLAVGEVAAHELAQDVVGTDGDFWGQDARRVGGEEGAGRGVACNGAGVVVVLGLESLKGSEIAAKKRRWDRLAWGIWTGGGQTVDVTVFDDLVCQRHATVQGTSLEGARMLRVCALAKRGNRSFGEGRQSISLAFDMLVWLARVGDGVLGEPNEDEQGGGEVHDEGSRSGGMIDW